MDDEERQKKLEAGKAKLAQFRQRKAHSDGQHMLKKQQQKKKISSIKGEESVQEEIATNQLQAEDASPHSHQRGAPTISEFSVINGGSSLTRSDVSSNFIREEEFGETYTEYETQHSVRHLEMMENELAGKQQEIEELNRELEEMRAAYDTDGLQQNAFILIRKMKSEMRRCPY